MSRESLALDISRVVSRVVNGEPVDTAERGAALAAKYPDLGMSGELIGQAIARAAGMVGLIRSAPPPQKPPAHVAEPAPVRAAVTSVETPPLPVTPPEPISSNAPAAGFLIDDELAAAIDAEIGNIVTGRKAEPAPANGHDDGSPASAAEHTITEVGRNGASAPKGRLAALRRALFRN